MHGLARFVVFDQADCGLSTMIFNSVQVLLILLFRNYQVTSDPALHLGTRDLWGQAQLEGVTATTAILELEIFGGRPSWKATGLQLQSGNSRFLGAGPVGRSHGYNCNLGTRDFWWQPQLEGDRATTAIWEPEIFWWQAQLKGEKGYNCNLGTRDFWGQAQLEGVTATTAILELEIFGGRPSWKATGLQLQSGNPRFFGGRPS